MSHIDWKPSVLLPVCVIEIMLIVVLVASSAPIIPPAPTLRHRDVSISIQCVCNQQVAGMFQIAPIQAGQRMPFGEPHFFTTGTVYSLGSMEIGTYEIEITSGSVTDHYTWMLYGADNHLTLNTGHFIVRLLASG